MRKLISGTQQIISEAQQNRDVNEGLDKKSLSVLLILPFCLTMIHYMGNYGLVIKFLLGLGANDLVKWMSDFFSGSGGFGELSYWVVVLVFFYFVVPALIIKFFFREKLSDYGLRIKGAFKGYYLYIIMLAVMVPLVLFFSGTESFQAKYPFIRLSKGDPLYPDLLRWEILYCAQFFALEFFFRGFVLFGLKRSLGIYSVFVMTVPYCMIHFGKPMPETIAAIIAGVVLGFLSLKNRSVWLGFLIHCSVGLAMDFASLWQKGFFD